MRKEFKEAKEPGMSGTSKSIVFDSFAIISHLKGESSSAQVEKYLVEVKDRKTIGYISAANLAEIYYIVWREKGYGNAEVLITSLKDWGLTIVSVDEDIAKKAGRFKAQYPLSLADAFAAATCQRFEAVLLTGDTEFRNLEDEVAIEWL
jgi:predicted nucleic acid-binding protein